MDLNWVMSFAHRLSEMNGSPKFNENPSSGKEDVERT